MFFSKIFDNIRVNKAIKEIENNNGIIETKSYLKWSIQEIIKSVTIQSNGYKEIEFINGRKIIFGFYYNK